MKRIAVKATPARRPLARAILALGAALGAGTVLAQAAADHDFKALGQADQFWSYFEDYCTECHNFDDFFGGVDFTTAFPTDVAENAALYEKVVKKLNGRMMPPPNRIRPPEERTDAFVAWLESYLDEAAAGRESVQHVAVHRLNRKEYANAIRDLFGIEIKPEELLPADDTSDGFDNIAEALKVSPAFINQYVSAARVISEQVVGCPHAEHELPGQLAGLAIPAYRRAAARHARRHAERARLPGGRRLRRHGQRARGCRLPLGRHGAEHVDRDGR